MIGLAVTPVVELLPYATGQDRRPGALRDEVWIADDFDELPAADGPAFAFRRQPGRSLPPITERYPRE